MPVVESSPRRLRLAFMLHMVLMSLQKASRGKTYQFVQLVPDHLILQIITVTQSEECAEVIHVGIVGSLGI